MRVGRCSPHSVAVFAVCQMQVLKRKVYKAYALARDEHFLLDGLLGFDLHGKTVGAFATRSIGQLLSTVLHGFGCQPLGHDVVESNACRALGLAYVGLDDLLSCSEILSVHASLTADTYHMINERT